MIDVLVVGLFGVHSNIILLIQLAVGPCRSIIQEITIPDNAVDGKPPYQPDKLMYSDIGRSPSSYWL